MASNEKPLQAAAVQDLSGFGRCSLTVALPVLSAMGVQLSCVPTAILSTHTGGFQGYTFRDLTDDLRPFLRHWQQEGFQFDALYTGYLGSPEQIGMVEEFFRAFRSPDTLVLVDPVMGDHGRLYSRFTPEMVAGIGRLCAGADVIVPNLTEAALLTGMPYQADHHSTDYLQTLCEKLRALGAKQVVVTGAAPRPGCMGAACLADGQFSIYAPRRVDAQYDGTGDLFASVLLGALMHRRPLSAAVQLAADFTRDCVARSVHNGTNPHFGVDFEPALWKLGQEIMTDNKE